MYSVQHMVTMESTLESNYIINVHSPDCDNSFYCCTLKRTPSILVTLWRHHGVLNYQPLDFLFSSLIKLAATETSKFRMQLRHMSVLPMSLSLSSQKGGRQEMSPLETKKQTRFTRNRPWGLTLHIRCISSWIEFHNHVTRYAGICSSCICLCPIQWSQLLSREWRCSWSNTCRRCSNYIWVINNSIAYSGATYIRGLTVDPLCDH